MAPQHTSAFWLCPSCGKHVPARQASCKCGFDRVVEKAAVSVITPRPFSNVRPPEPLEPSRGAPWNAIAALSVVAIVVAGAFKVAVDSPSEVAPKPSQSFAGLAEPGAAGGPGDYAVTLESQQASPPTASTPLSAAEQVELAARLVREQRERSEGLQGTPAAGTAGGAAAGEAIQRREAMQQEQKLQEAADLQRRTDEETAKARFWRGENEKVVTMLQAALSSYQLQLCSDMRGGISLSGGGEDMRPRYLSARSQARDFEERARRADARSMVEINWPEFPEPEAAGAVQPLRLSMTRVKWKCPSPY